MVKSHGMLVTGIALILVCVVAAAAQPTHGALVPPPPGGVVQNQRVYLNGQAMNGQWRAVASKKLVGASNGNQFYQWYLSIYAPRSAAYRLRYQSPVNGGPLERVTKANGASMWFPVQELRIVGAADLMRPGVQQLVVQSHEMAADCGSSTVTVFAGGPGGSVVPAASVANPCELSATIVRSDNSISLAGPYYSATAPMCCPTKPKASAVLRYRGGRWIESPSYYKLYPGRLPPG
jgi:hypothetical protein